MYEVCDSKSEKSAPMYCFEGSAVDSFSNLEVFAVIAKLRNQKSGFVPFLTPPLSIPLKGTPFVTACRPVS